MRLIKANGRGLVFHLLQRERDALLNTIELYPLVPEAHHRLSKTEQGDNAEENQQLLDEALGEQRAENRRNVLDLLQKPKRFRKAKTGLEVTFKRTEVEWLLQVLNDIRVGCWIALGEPEQGEEPHITSENVRYHFRLSLAGEFQSIFLEALGVTQSQEWADA